MSCRVVRAGLVFDLSKPEQVVVSAEIGRERLEVDSHTESLAGNPFDATLAPATDRVDVAKARLAWSFGLAPHLDATLWGGGVYGFNRDSDLIAAWAGVGVFTAVTAPTLPEPSMAPPPADAPTACSRDRPRTALPTA